MVCNRALSLRQFIKDIFKTDIWEREVKIQAWPATALQRQPAAQILRQGTRPIALVIDA